jgi:hypothetical protein
MQIDRIKYAVLDFVKERKYARGPFPIAVVSILLAACLIWIASFLFGGDSYRLHSPPDTPSNREAAAITQRLREDERFRYLSVVPAEDEANTLIITGEVHTKADRAALISFMETIESSFTVRESVFVMGDN